MREIKIRVADFEKEFGVYLGNVIKKSLRFSVNSLVKNPNITYSKQVVFTFKRNLTSKQISKIASALKIDEGMVFLYVKNQKEISFDYFKLKNILSNKFGKIERIFDKDGEIYLYLN